MTARIHLRYPLGRTLTVGVTRLLSTGNELFGVYHPSSPGEIGDPRSKEWGRICDVAEVTEIELDDAGGPLW